MQNIIQFITDHWAIVALVLSEVLSFLPTKVSGIAQLIFSVLKAIFQKKENETLKKNNPVVAARYQQQKKDLSQNLS